MTTTRASVPDARFRRQFLRESPIPKFAGANCQARAVRLKVSELRCHALAVSRPRLAPAVLTPPQRLEHRSPHPAAFPAQLASSPALRRFHPMHLLLPPMMRTPRREI